MSQCGQDQWLIDRIFHHKRQGVFVEVGANDGITYSNTLLLENKYDWTGMLIEPHPLAFATLKKNRPKCLLVNKAVSTQTQNVPFQCINGYSEMLSGMVHTYDSRHQARIARELNEKRGTSSVISVETVSLRDLFQKYDIRHIDYLSIDVEGAEQEVLDTIDFSQVTIDVIGVEVNYPEFQDPLETWMKQRNYAFLKKKGDDCFFSYSI